ncbi:22848_t:CDS:2, partial [Gigaspora rosea]
ESAGCIKAQDVPGIAELDKFCRKEINKPAPQVSTHTIPSSEWEIPVPNPSRLILSHLTRENLVKELEKRKFNLKIMR